MTYRDKILGIIMSNPGATGVEIHKVLTRGSRMAGWFGEDAFITALLGASSGKMYVVLTELEMDGAVRAEWGHVNAYGNRPRRYWVV